MATTKKNGQATGRQVEKKTVKGRQVVVGKKAPAKKAPKTEGTVMQKKTGSPIPKGPKGHRNCVAGTRKEQVAICFDKSGKDAAIALADKLGLKPNTAKAWLGFWVRSDRNTVAPKKGK